MLKRRSQFFKSALFLIDLLTVESVWLASFWLRFETDWVPLTKPRPPLEPYLWMSLPILAAFGLILPAFDLYRTRRISGYAAEVWDIARAASLGVLVVLGLTFFVRHVEFSRVVFAFFWAGAVVGLALSRRLARALLRLARRRGYNLRFALIVGAGTLGQEIARRVRRHPEFGIKLAGFLTRHPEKIGTELAGAPVLGLYDDLERVLKERPVDQVFFALPLRDQWRIEELFRPVVDGVYDVKVVPDLLHFMTLRGAAEMLDGMPVISMQHSPLAGWNSVAKRGLDLAFSLVVLTLTAPVLALIAVAIKLGSPGPVFFRQQRMGLDGRLFEMLKFRTMRTDAESESGPVWAVANDPRRTPLGRLLRSTSLDELPQFINVLRGDMSVVGPRPERPEFVAQFRKSVPKYMLRHMIKAGITGLAQVQGWRGNTSIEERIKCDLEYIENWSLLLDLKIMCVTVWRGFINRSAY